jgi:hypothetical protein
MESKPQTPLPLLGMTQTLLMHFCLGARPVTTLDDVSDGYRRVRGEERGGEGAYTVAGQLCGRHCADHAQGEAEGGDGELHCCLSSVGGVVAVAVAVVGVAVG